MTAFTYVALGLATICAAVSAPAQSNAELSVGANPAIDAVDASVHAEVDGQPHELSPEKNLGERPTALRAAKRHTATVVWPAHSDISTTKTDVNGAPAAVAMSSFRPRKESQPDSAAQPSDSLTSGSAKKKDSSKSRAGQLNTPLSHSSGYGKATSTLKTIAPAASESTQTPAFEAPFERPLSGLAASTEPFPKRDPYKYKDQSNAKQHHHASKPVTNSATKSPLHALTARH
jgi:hypothetical protein